MGPPEENWVSFIPQATAQGRDTGQRNLQAANGLGKTSLFRLLFQCLGLWPGCAQTFGSMPWHYRPGSSLCTLTVAPCFPALSASGPWPGSLLPAPTLPTPDPALCSLLRAGPHLLPLLAAAHAAVLAMLLCLAMGVSRPSLGLSHLLALRMAPSGRNASLWLLLAVFLRNKPVDTHGQSSGDSLFNLGEEPVK